jgi:hypothetical protein
MGRNHKGPKNTLDEIKNKKGDEVQHLWDIFKTQLESTMNTNIPHKEIKSRNSIPLVRKKERKMLKKKQRLYRQARKTKKWSNYRSYQKECKRHLRKAEYEYINQNIFEGIKNNNTKPFWKYIKSKRQDAGGIAPLKKGVNLISDSKGRAELLLDQFKSVFTKTTDNTLPKKRIQAKTDIPPIKSRRV